MISRIMRPRFAPQTAPASPVDPPPYSQASSPVQPTAMPWVTYPGLPPAYTDLAGFQHPVNDGGVVVFPYAMIGNPGGATDDAAAVQAMLSAAGFSRGRVLLGPWAYNFASILALLPTQYLICQRGTIINFTGTGDCISMTQTTYTSDGKLVGGGVLGRPTIDGSSAGAGSSGLHVGDIEQLEFDAFIQNFTGAGSIAAHFDNRNFWTEQLKARLHVWNCTAGVVFDVSGTTGTNSFARADVSVYVNMYANQDAVVLQNGARLYDGTLRIYGNMAGSASPVSNACLRITGAVPAGHTGAGSPSRVQQSRVDMGLESSASAYNPYTIAFGSSANLLQGSGALAFHGGMTPSATLVTSGQFQFDGYVYGDANLNPGTAVGPVELPSWTQITAGFPAGWSGSIKYRKLGNTRVQIDWALTITSGTVLSPGAVVASLPAGFYYTGDSKSLGGTLQGNSTNSYAPASITSAGNFDYEGPSLTLTTTGYWYGQAEYNTTA